MIKAILFDLWNTIIYNEPPNPLDVFSEKVGKTMSDYPYLKILERNLMLKEYDDIKVVVRNILRELKVKEDDGLVDDLSRILTEIDMEKIKQYPKTLVTLKKLKRKFKLGLISNSYDPKIFELIDSKFGLSKIFDYVGLSYEVGLIKPDERLFKLVLENIGVKEEEAVMVGDTLKDDVEAAEKIGIRGILFDVKNNHPEHTRRIVSLDEIYNYL